jgi:hypothetical protein
MIITAFKRLLSKIIRASLHNLFNGDWNVRIKIKSVNGSRVWSRYEVDWD